MSRTILAAAALAAAIGGAAAQPRYDSSLAQAAAAIVADRIGEIRGGFDFDEMPEFVRPIEWRPASRSGLDARTVASTARVTLRPTHAF